ncbi:MAG: hypothetical protein AMXMBFR84_03880 [Candidatus Hydrogenedentota bacterium]
MPDYFVLCVACGQVNRVASAPIGSSIRCKSCNRPVTLTEENAVPTGEGETAAPMEIVYGEDNAMRAASRRQGKDCDRCGKPFRGDWDKHETENGLLCNICANQYREPDPGFSNRIEPIEDNELPFADCKPSVNPDEPPPKTPFEENMQKVAIVGAIFVVGLGILFFFYDPQPLPSIADEESAQQAIADTAKDVPSLVYFIAYAFRFGAGIAAQFIALYLILSWTKNLPNDTLWKNIIALAVIAVALSAINMVPCFGTFLAVAFVIYLYRVDWQEAFIFLILTSLAHILVWVAGQFVVGALTWVFA